jgi:hypothetical protein
MLEMYGVGLVLLIPKLWPCRVTNNEKWKMISFVETRMDVIDAAIQLQYCVPLIKPGLYGCIVQHRIVNVYATRLD